MFKKLSKLSIVTIISLVIGLFSLKMQQPVLAEICNPAISATLGCGADNAKAGIPFSIYFVTLWRGIITVGGLMVFIFFLWGAIEWITAGGDSGKVTKARDKITQSIIGFLLLVSTGIILAFFGKVFFGDTFNFFQLTVPVSTGTAGTGTTTLTGPGTATTGLTTKH